MIDPVDVKEGVAERPRHERIDFDDNRLGVAQHAHRDVDRDAEADEAAGVGRRHLHEGDIGLHAAVLRIKCGIWVSEIGTYSACPL